MMCDLKSLFAWFYHVFDVYCHASISGLFDYSVQPCAFVQGGSFTAKQVRFGSPQSD